MIFTVLNILVCGNVFSALKVIRAIIVILLLMNGGRGRASMIPDWTMLVDVIPLSDTTALVYAFDGSRCALLSAGAPKTNLFSQQSSQ